MENIHGKCDICDKIAMVITNTSIKKGCERKTKTGQMIMVNYIHGLRSYTSS